MATQIDDGLENEPKPPQKKKKAGAQEEEETVGQKRELWPLIPAIPVIIAIALSLIPERADIDQVDLARGRCMSQLRLAATMKQEIAAADGITEGMDLAPERLAEIKKVVSCPAGGNIDVRPVGQEPRCALHGTMSAWEAEQQNLGHWHDITRQTK